MYEVMALGVGGLVGLLVARMGLSLWWTALLGALGGMTVTGISGELETSAGYLLCDAGRACAAAVLVGILLRYAFLWNGRTASDRSSRARAGPPFEARRRTVAPV